MYLSGEGACRYLNLQASYAVLIRRRRILRMASIDSVGPIRRGLRCLEITPGIPAHFLCAAIDHDLRSAGTGTPAIFTLKEPRLVRVQKYTVFQSSPPNATLAVLPKPWTTRPSFLPVGSRI
jgi:hypothetical protein